MGGNGESHWNKRFFHCILFVLNIASELSPTIYDI